MKRKLTDITTIIIHCSDSFFGNASLINEWHKQNGWAGIGYHHVILNGVLEHGDPYDHGLDGTLQDGRSIYDVGAHCHGHNADSIGVCMIGKAAFTERQIERLRWLVRLYVARFRIPLHNVLGHYELNPNKTCPNIDMDQFRRSLVED
jgi:hypothetical protein